MIIVDEDTDTITPATPTVIYTDASVTSATYVVQISTYHLDANSLDVTVTTSVDGHTSAFDTTTVTNSAGCWNIGPYPIGTSISVSVTLTAGGDIDIPWKVFKL